MMETVTECRAFEQLGGFDACLAVARTSDQGRHHDIF